MSTCVGPLSPHVNGTGLLSSDALQGADAPCLEFGLDVADGVGELGEDCQCEPYAETALHLPNRRSKDFDFDSFGYWDRMTSISFGESFPLLLK